MDYLMLVGASILQSLAMICSKIYQRRVGASFNRSLAFIAGRDLLSALLMFAINGFTFRLTSTALILGAAATLTGLVSGVIGMRALKITPLALYTFFLMSGGMLVPYVYGLCFLGETLTVFRILGVLLILGALFVSGKEGFRNCGVKSLVLCALIFFFNGTVNTLSKLHQIHPDAVTAAEFSIICSLIRAAVCLPFLFTTRPDSDEPARFPAIGIALTVATAVISGICYLLQLMSAATLPATVCYPVMTG